MATHVGKVLTSLVLVAGVSYSCAPPRLGPAGPGPHQVAVASAVEHAHRG